MAKSAFQSHFRPFDSSAFPLFVSSSLRLFVGLLCEDAGGDASAQAFFSPSYSSLFFRVFPPKGFPVALELRRVGVGLHL